MKLVASTQDHGATYNIKFAENAEPFRVVKIEGSLDQKSGFKATSPEFPGQTWFATTMKGLKAGLEAFLLDNGIVSPAATAQVIEKKVVRKNGNGANVKAKTEIRRYSR